jgi:hypothetical protein
MLCVINRDVSGKTTVILHRMYYESMQQRALEDQASAAAAASVSSLGATDSSLTYCRQLLLTASPILCDAIERSYTQLCQASEGGAPPASDSLLSVGRGDMRDASSSSSSADSNSRPASMSECNDASFPLITTYATFIRMLDACLNKPFFSQPSFEMIEPREITFERFQFHYYPRFDKTLLLDASLLYGEFGELCPIFAAASRLCIRVQVAAAVCRKRPTWLCQSSEAAFSASSRGETSTEPS